jgi:hypothetical protein
VEGLADFCLVLGVAHDWTLLVSTMGELALDSVAACVGLHEGTAEFGLVQVLLGDLLLDDVAVFLLLAALANVLWGGWSGLGDGPWVDV